MVFKVRYAWYRWRYTRAGSGWGPSGLSGAGGFASVVAVGAVLLLLRSLVSGCSLMLFVRLRLGLSGAVCCFVSAAPVCAGCFRPSPAALGLARVLPFCVVGQRSWAGSPPWSVPFGVSRCCLRCNTYSHHCVSLKHLQETLNTKQALADPHHVGAIPAHYLIGTANLQAFTCDDVIWLLHLTPDCLLR